MLKFICPKCGGNNLNSVEKVYINYPITKIYEDGNCDYDTCTYILDDDGEVVAYQCANQCCGYELTDSNGNVIDELMDIPEWIKENCKE